MSSSQSWMAIPEAVRPFPSAQSQVNRILYVGMGEKLSDLEQFYPDRMASRILGMGDIQSLIEKAAAEVDEEQAKELSQKLRKAEFDYNDFLTQMQQIKKRWAVWEVFLP